MLEARGLSKAYRTPSGTRLPVLAGVDVAVKAGQLVVITGPSGSGKSTLLNVLGLLEDPDAGEVWYAGGRVSSTFSSTTEHMPTRISASSWTSAKSTPEPLSRRFTKV